MLILHYLYYAHPQNVDFLMISAVSSCKMQNVAVLQINLPCLFCLISSPVTELKITLFMTTGLQLVQHNTECFLVLAAS